MGNYHWQLIPQAYRGIPDTSQWSICLSEASHTAEPPTCTCHWPYVAPSALSLTYLIPGSLCLCIESHTQSCITVLATSFLKLYLCPNTSLFPLISFDADMHMFILEGNIDFQAQSHNLHPMPMLTVCQCKSCVMRQKARA